MAVTARGGRGQGAQRSRKGKGASASRAPSSFGRRARALHMAEFLVEGIAEHTLNCSLQLASIDLPSFWQWPTL